MKVILELQPPDRSALKRVQEPEESAWGLQEQLLAAIADAARFRVWQEGSGKAHDRPKPIPRPGIETGTKTHHKHDVLPVSEFAEWLGPDFAELVPA